MVRIALDSAQGAKGAVVQVLADMTAMERGNSPYDMATDSRRPTDGPSTESSSTGPWRMYPVSKKAVCKKAKARAQGDPDEPARSSTEDGMDMEPAPEEGDDHPEQ